MPVFATVASGFAVSSALTLSPVDGRRWAIYVPSMTGSTVRLDFSAVSGGAGDFGTLHSTPDQSAVIVSSTVRPAWSTFLPPTPWCRVSFGGVNVSDTATVALVAMTAR